MHDGNEGDGYQLYKIDITNTFALLNWEKIITI